MNLRLRFTDIQTEAVFLPDVSGISTDSSLRSFIEYVDALDELTKKKRNKRLLIFFFMVSCK